MIFRSLKTTYLALEEMNETNHGPIKSTVDVSAWATFDPSMAVVHFPHRRRFTRSIVGMRSRWKSDHGWTHFPCLDPRAINIKSVMVDPTPPMSSMLENRWRWPSQTCMLQTPFVHDLLFRTSMYAIAFKRLHLKTNYNIYIWPLLQ